LIAAGGPVIVSLAPSFASVFYRAKTTQVIAALKKLGFCAVSETALGADLVSHDIAGDIKDAVKNNAGKPGQKLFLSSACPAVLLYVKRYAPAFIPFMNNRASPLSAHALLLKKLYGKNISVVFIGPCAAKKQEAEQMRELSAALTFNELCQWLGEENIVPEKLTNTSAEDFIPCRAAKGALYPVNGGMFDSINNYLEKDGINGVSFLNITGLNRAAEFLKEATDSSGFGAPVFVQLLACQGGCINGAGAPRPSGTLAGCEHLLSYAKSAANHLKDEMLSGDPVLKRRVNVKGSPPFRYRNGEIQNVLASIRCFGKLTDCSICGYENCAAFAKALIDGRAEKSMCVVYSLNLTEHISGALLHNSRSGIVVVDKNLRIIECNKNFARLLGKEEEELYVLADQFRALNIRKFIDFAGYFEDALKMDAPVCSSHNIRIDKRILRLAVYTVETGTIVSASLDDISTFVNRNIKTVLDARKIIEKNRTSIQKIAFQLGENLAETTAFLSLSSDESGK
jgi:PAS domain-containing protein